MVFSNLNGFVKCAELSGRIPRADVLSCFGFLLVAEDWKLLEEEGGQNENLALSKLTAGKLQWWWDVHFPFVRGWVEDRGGGTGLLGPPWAQQGEAVQS